VAVTVAQLKAEFPEFAHTDPVLIAAKLRDAQGSVNESAFGGHHDTAVLYYTAHLISLSPSGEFARLVASEQSDGASSTYERHYRRIVRGLAGPMVV
jgi:hypothetical protein